eukprot:ANDGO_03616.mRNA.1 hypothetical protein
MMIMLPMMGIENPCNLPSLFHLSVREASLRLGVSPHTLKQMFASYCKTVVPKVKIPALSVPDLPAPDAVSWPYVKFRKLFERRSALLRIMEFSASTAPHPRSSSSTVAPARVPSESVASGVTSFRDVDPPTALEGAMLNRDVCIVDSACNLLREIPWLSVDEVLEHVRSTAASATAGVQQSMYTASRIGCCAAPFHNAQPGRCNPLSLWSVSNHGPPHVVPRAPSPSLLHTFSIPPAVPQGGALQQHQQQFLQFDQYSAPRNVAHGGIPMGGMPAGWGNASAAGILSLPQSRYPALGIDADFRRLLQQWYQKQPSPYPASPAAIQTLDKAYASHSSFSGRSASNENAAMYGWDFRGMQFVRKTSASSMLTEHSAEDPHISAASCHLTDHDSNASVSPSVKQRMALSVVLHSSVGDVALPEHSVASQCCSSSFLGTNVHSVCEPLGLPTAPLPKRRRGVRSPFQHQ